MGKQGKFFDSLKDRQFRVGRRRSLFRGSAINAQESNSYNILADQYSAKSVLTAKQRKTFIITFFISAVVFLLIPTIAVFVIGLLFVVFYSSVVLFRAAILRDYDKSQKPIFDIKPNSNTGDKTYSVLVALYKEAGQVNDLVVALNKLKWPKNQIDIYLICEEIDLETISAITKLKLPDHMQLVICPKGAPQTKPRALNYVLQNCSSDYLVIYDAEDRPHPNQLLEAHNTFKNNSEKLACLQAPLLVDNVNETWLTKMFAIEYTTLFSGILLSLSGWEAPMPLGGTSNHFRTTILKKVGGWDAYNVTEDADLGIRLARYGFNCGIINSPTYEEAPTSISIWLPQRTRWLKGWVQTLLVHMRSPSQLLKDLGWRNFMMFHLLITGIVISILIHPVFIIIFPIQVYNYVVGNNALSYESFIIGISTFTLVAGYLTYGFLAMAVTKDKPFTPNRLWLLSIPVYWLFISIAGWRAVFQLFTAPHKWEKTEHGNSTRATPKT